MKRLRVLAMIAVAGCTTDPAWPPTSVSIETEPCTQATVACIDAGAVTRDVAGIRVIHKAVKGDPVIAMNVIIDGGDRSGMQLWSESMAMEMLDLAGTKKIDLPAWRAVKSSIGASVTATMSHDFGIVSAVAPVVFWHDLWSLVSGAIADPANDDYLLDYLQGYIQSSYDTELDDPDSAAGIVALSSLLDETSGNQFRATRNDARLVATQDVDQAWASMRTKDRLSIVVVGDVEWSDVASKVEHAFGRLPGQFASYFPAPPPRAPSRTENQARVLPYPESPHWQITGYFRAPPPTDPDYAPLDAAMKILDQRLFEQVRDARGLAYSVGAFLTFEREPIGGLSLGTNTPSRALPVVERAIADLIDVPVTAEEIATARALLGSSLVASNRTPMSVAGTLGRYQLVTGDRLGIDRYFEALSAVTPETARIAFERYFRAVSVAAAGSGEPLDEASLLAVLSGRRPDGGASGATDGALDPADGG